MTTAAYAVRKLNYTFTIGTGNFGTGGSTQLVLPDGLRSECHIEYAVTPSTGLLHAYVYGLSLDHMNQISKAGLVWSVRKNYVQVDAGDAVSGMTTIFRGQILEAYPDMKRQPETPLYLFAIPSADSQLAPVKPVSFSTGTSAETALGAILKPAGIQLENNGVTGVLSTPYFAGTAWNQVLSAVRSLGCFAYYDGVANTLSIWPKDGARAGTAVTVSPDTGLVGYPTFQSQQVIFTMLFDPAIQPAIGREVTMKSGLTAADGTLRIMGVNFDLSAQVPKGPWFMTVTSIPKTLPTS